MLIKNLISNLLVDSRSDTCTSNTLQPYGMEEVEDDGGSSRIAKTSFFRLITHILSMVAHGICTYF